MSPTAVVKVHLFTNPPSHGKPSTISISWLEGDDGQEMPCPLDEDYRFTDFEAVKEALGRYFGASFTFELGEL